MPVFEMMKAQQEKERDELRMLSRRYDEVRSFIERDGKIEPERLRSELLGMLRRDDCPLHDLLIDHMGEGDASEIQYSLRSWLGDTLNSGDNEDDDELG